MGFLNYYKHIQSLNEAVEITPYDAYDEYTKWALDKIFSEKLKSWIQSANLRPSSICRLDRSSMEKYKEKNSNPVRLATSTSDFDKLVYRYNWCLENWPEAADVYKQRIYEVLATDPAHAKNVMKIINDRMAQEEKERKFEEDVNNASTDKYAPKERDWMKMIDYMNKKSDPYRVAQSCKDANKIVARYCIAKALKWEGAISAFKQRAFDKKEPNNWGSKETLTGLTEAELEAYARKYANTNIPEQWQEYIDSLRESDIKGGVAQHMSDSSGKDVNTNMSKYLDKCIEISDYESVADSKGKKISNGCKIIRYDKADIWIRWRPGYNHNKRQGWRRDESTAYMNIYVYRSYEDFEQDIHGRCYSADMAAEMQSTIDRIANNI